LSELSATRRHHTDGRGRIVSTAEKEHLTEREAEKAALSDHRNAPEPSPKVSFYPNLATVYARKVDELRACLRMRSAEAMEAVQ
jgi:hypothetical protein